MKAHLDITKSADETRKIPPTRTLAPVEKAAPAQSWGAFFGGSGRFGGAPAQIPPLRALLAGRCRLGPVSGQLHDVAGVAGIFPPKRKNRSVFAIASPPASGDFGSSRRNCGASEFGAGSVGASSATTRVSALRKVYRMGPIGSRDGTDGWRGDLSSKGNLA